MARDRTEPGERYDRATIVLHWTTAVLVVVLWLSAQVIDWFPRGPARVNMRSVHMLLGVALAAVLASRVGWRLSGGVRLPADDVAWRAWSASAVHYVLYALLVTEVLLGLFNAWTRGESVFNLFTIPAFQPDDRALRRTVGKIHEWVANTILVAAGLHAAAALVHHYVWKDGVLRRMLRLRAAR